MLLNVIVAVEDEKLRGRILRALNTKNVVANVITEERNLWKHVGRKACDVIILSHTLFPGTIADEIQTIKNLPEKPVIAIISAEATEEERAHFLTAGFDGSCPTCR